MNYAVLLIGTAQRLSDRLYQDEGRKLHPDLVHSLTHVLAQESAPNDVAMEAFARLLHSANGKSHTAAEVDRYFDHAKESFQWKINDKTVALPAVLETALRDPEVDVADANDMLKLWKMTLRFARMSEICGTGQSAVRRTVFLIEETLDRALSQINYERFGVVLPAMEDLRGFSDDHIDKFYPDRLFTANITVSWGELGGLAKQIEYEMKHSPDPFLKANQQEPEEKAGADLSNIIGLENVKREFRSLEASIRLQQLRKLLGMEPEEEAEAKGYHLVFRGPPGTNKTSFARLVGGLYKDLGILSSGHVVETKRGGLIGGYIGHTTWKTDDMIKKAMNGVLFIDEAYQLFNTSSNDFGHEAVAEIMTAMENDRHRLVVIMAGYGDEMDELLQSNPGLPSRFRKVVDFESYKAEELHAIFNQKAAQSGLIVEGAAQQLAHERISEALARIPEKYFGNGRYIRSFVNEMADEMAIRLLDEGVLEPAGKLLSAEGTATLKRIFQGDAANRLVTITPADIERVKLYEPKEMRGDGYSKVGMGFTAKLG